MRERMQQALNHKKMYRVGNANPSKSTIDHLEDQARVEISEYVEELTSSILRPYDDEV